jgi:hypothetical protein
MLSQGRRGGHKSKRYLYVCIGGGGLVAVHHLVLETFDRAWRPETGEQGRHLNDVSTDNGIENLAWGSYDDNAADRMSNGGYRKKTHCVRNHPYDESNTWHTKEGWQQCRTCHRERARKAAA